jgi:hypothetical protein
MTKNRIITIAAALAVTIGAVPATSNAKPNNGGFSRSIEGNKKKTYPGFCADARALNEGSLSDMQGAIAAGDYAASFKALDQAAQIRGQAKKAGCAWAWVS